MPRECWGVHLPRLYNHTSRMLDFHMKYGEKAIRKAPLEIWENPESGRDYEISISFPEFTCLCPRSGYPDFATIRIIYMPDKSIVELKSLKLYLNSFRDVHVSHEEVTNRIYSELEKRLKPRFLEVIGDFNPRGNVKTIVRVCSEKAPKKSGAAEKC
jgi:7-cyano-7-deazaguanine reductase